MWNQKPYTKNLTCKHKTEELENGDKSRLIGIIMENNRDKREIVVYAETFTKDAKSKVRTFYKHFYQLVKKFVDNVDLYEEKQRAYCERPDLVIEELRRLWEKEKEEAEREAERNAALLKEANESVSRDETVIDSSQTTVIEESKDEIKDSIEEMKVDNSIRDFDDSMIIKPQKNILDEKVTPHGLNDEASFDISSASKADAENSKYADIEEMD